MKSWDALVAPESVSGTLTGAALLLAALAAIAVGAWLLMGLEATIGKATLGGLMTFGLTLPVLMFVRHWITRHEPDFD